MTKETCTWETVRLIGSQLQLSEHNLQKMEQRGYVPPKHHYSFVKKAEDIGVRLTFEDLEALRSENVHNNA